MTDSFFVEGGASKEYKMVPVGTHLGRCFRIVDLGTQKATYEGNTKFLRKVRVYWELHGEDDKGEPLVTDKGEPLAMQKDYNLTFAEKSTLRKDIQNWFGVQFTDEEALRYDLKKILDKWGMINVVHAVNGNKTYANVGSITSVPSIIAKHGLPDPHNELQMFRLASPDLELFGKFPRSLKSRIFMSPEGQDMKKRHNLPDVEAYQNDKAAPQKQSSKSSGFDDMEDDIPF